MSRSPVSRVSETPSLERVAGRDEHGVGDQQREARGAVDAVPGPDALEPDRVEHGNARQQQQLDERQVGAEQAGDAAQAREQPRDVVDLADAALRHHSPTTTTALAATSTATSHPVILRRDASGVWVATAMAQAVSRAAHRAEAPEPRLIRPATAWVLTLRLARRVIQ